MKMKKEWNENFIAVIAVRVPQNLVPGRQW